MVFFFFFTRIHPESEDKKENDPFFVLEEGV